MSHLHIPDGILSLWLWLLGYLIVGIYFLIVYKHLKKTANYKKIAMTGVLGALMLLAMSIPVPFVIPYHLNLSALLGILAGPFYAGLAIFSVNFIIALVGHGGITIVGLNTIVITIEAIIAFLLFNLIRKYFRKIFPAAFIATFIALIVSTFLTIGIVYTGTKNLDYLAHKCSHQHEQTIPYEHDQVESFNIKRFMFLILMSGSLGWTLEALLTAFIATYISRVKPDLLENKDFYS